MADKILTPEEYMSVKRFPLTTQTEYGGLSLDGQLMIDATNYDSLKEGVELGEEMDEEQIGRLAELEEKMKSAPTLRKQLAEQEKAANRAKKALADKK